MYKDPKENRAAQDAALTMGTCASNAYRLESPYISLVLSTIRKNSAR